jgi:SAM-dependent methyltransferase
MPVHDPALAVAAIHEKYAILTNSPPLPHESLLHAIGAGNLENFYVAGEAFAHILNRWIPRGAAVMDIGCGPGRTARFLLFRDDITYVGFDIFKPCIEWAQRFLAPYAAGRFRFEHFDAFSAHYNPRGPVKATEVKFPAADGSIDVAFAASLFTHLLEPDSRHYLRESARVLSRSGILVASIHDEPPAGEKYTGRENRIDVDKDYFIDMAREAGLAVKLDFGLVCGQEVLVFRKA